MRIEIFSVNSSLAKLSQPARSVITPDNAAALRIQHDRCLRDNQFSSGEVEPPPRGVAAESQRG